MGLIQAVKGAVSSTLADQWKELIYSDSLDENTLVQKGCKKVTEGSSNQYGSENIITEGSHIIVNEGQALLIVENGKIIDFSVEPGAYIFKSNTEPSLFANGMQGLIDSFKKMGKRFTFGGQPSNVQVVYYVNLKENPNHKFGVYGIPFRDAEFNFTLRLKGYGVYSYKIEDPILFFSHVSANVKNSYLASSIEEQLKAEFQQAIQMSLGTLSSTGMRYDAIPQHTGELVATMDKMLDVDWKQKRGMSVVSIGFSSIVPDEESTQKIAQFQEARVYSNAAMLGGRLGGAQATAMEQAASNQNGSINGFVGMGFAQQMGGASAAQFIKPNMEQNSFSEQKNSAEEWICTCNAKNNGKFCSNCGKRRDTICSHSRAINGAKFCPDCGEKLQ